MRALGVMADLLVVRAAVGADPHLPRRPRCNGHLGRGARGALSWWRCRCGASVRGVQPHAGGMGSRIGLRARAEGGDVASPLFGGLACALISGLISAGVACWAALLVA
ncbi:hypothetical protein JCM12141A_02220 [Mycolicibacterium hodleri]